MPCRQPDPSPAGIWSCVPLMALFHSRVTHGFQTACIFGVIAPPPLTGPCLKSNSSREPRVLCSETSSPAAAERRLSPGQQMQTLLGPLGKPERGKGRFPSQEGWIYVPVGGLRDLVLEQGLPDSTGTGSLQPLPPHLGTPGRHLSQRGDKCPWSAQSM